MTRKGSVLLHILVTGTVVALIAALLLRMGMLRYLIGARAIQGAQMRRDDESALARVMSYWNSANTLCANNVPGYSCLPASTIPPGTCGCTCTPTDPKDAVVVSASSSGNCRLRIASADLLP